MRKVYQQICVAILNFQQMSHFPVIRIAPRIRISRQYNLRVVCDLETMQSRIHSYLGSQLYVYCKRQYSVLLSIFIQKIHIGMSPLLESKTFNLSVNGFVQAGINWSNKCDGLEQEHASQDFCYFVGQLCQLHVTC